MSGPVRVTALGKVATGSVLWRAAGRLHVTVVVKAVFTLREGEMMQRTAASRVNADDSYNGDDPQRSVRLPSDLAPYLARTDVVFVGNAYAPPGTKTSTVRFAVQRGEETLFDKRLTVNGARQSWEDEPKPFNRMPIDFEHAFGGAGIDENPVGTGAQGGVPNVIDAVVKHRPGSFGALARSWQARRRLLSAEALSGLQQRVLELPPAFDWSYFHAAPEDQRIPHLRGDEWLLLEGLIPGKASFRSQLPHASAMARVWAAGAPESDPGYPVALAADQLAVLGDARMCTVTWRGSFPIESEQVLPGLMIAAGVEHQGEPIDWGAVFRQAEARPAVDLTNTDSEGLMLNTVQHKADEMLRDAIAKRSAPAAVSPKSPAFVPAAIAAALPKGNVVELSDADVQSSTSRQLQKVIIDDESTTQRVQRVTTGTVSMKIDAKNSPWLKVDLKATTGGQAAPKDAAPFAMAPAGRQTLRPVDIPGAPWSKGAAAATAEPKNAEVTSTVDIEKLLAAQAATPAPPEKK